MRYEYAHCLRVAPDGTHLPPGSMKCALDEFGKHGWHVVSTDHRYYLMEKEIPVVAPKSGKRQ